ncbi:Ig-like domain-containing protein [Flavobacterium sp. SUN046]|uniref:Ig-like domain-containing protein n=1 Tax=Flavobacterium sp. SUN046 TaxID=3002440 RepID=UPI002DB642B2|nr:Ig-like domain-containing protein [Flavobacterium sp. SUN046]MEC4048005.1 Ig-like domain-containing protein [Flavobacterium sp. SUN046]
MQKNFSKYCLVLLLVILASCAKRGTITGGDKDTIAPVLESSFPKNLSKNFVAKEIQLNFDEYVKLKDVNKQLIISPPLKNTPEILPYNPSKKITIRFKDTLQANTTYSLNFGQSILDNNEGNPMAQLKYVFSTGTYIDSLVQKASIKDALELKKDNFVSIMLYEIDEKFNDSTIFKKTPRYITNTLDSITIAKLENLKQGTYQMIALKDVNGNNKFDPKIDKIGFIKEPVVVPNDKLYQMALFKEAIPFKAVKVSQVEPKKFYLGYEGKTKDIKITVKRGAEIIPHLVTKLPKRDTLQIWMNPLKNDSIKVTVSKDKFEKTFPLKIKEQKKDSLKFSTEQSASLNLREKFTLNSNVPLTKFDLSKMKLINKDSTDVKFTTEYDEYNQDLKFNFNVEPLEKYSLKILPGALTDFYERTNDSLKYTFTTSNASDYGNLKVVLENIKRFPLIIQLTDKDGKVLFSEYSEKENTVNFDLIPPNKYTLRVIYDDNKNKEWDPGNYLEKRQAEEVVYFPKEIDLHSNWDWIESFDLKE